MATPRQSGTRKANTKQSSTRKRSSTKDGGAARPRGGLAQPVRPSSELAAVVGNDSLTRAELTKRVWDYVKKHKLQDSQNRRMINADAKLKPIFGGKSQVSMFEMTKLINQHVR